jgi:CRISPR/Cas system CSM-associated protein Csm3 (group 7 of RAMP superfamily)
MQTIKYKIEFYDFWHIGSGQHSGVVADAIVSKTKNNLPFIPGRTLKGLLREAAEVLNSLNGGELVSSEFIESVFGNETTATETNKAISFFSNAYLSNNLSEKLVNSKLSSNLYRLLSSTALDDKGQAKKGSLRTLEVTIPLTLYGSVIDVPNEQNYSSQLEHCFNYVKRMGVNRNRGLGACNLEILKEQ